MTKLTIECVDFKPLERNTLRGFATIRIPQMRMTIDGVAVHERDGQRWAQLPSKPMVDKAGELVREDNGKIKYAKVFAFDSAEVTKAFSTAVIVAVEDKAFRRDFMGGGNV